jgi:acetyltransferase AlgX (SGNH hydrolase-like protein)
LVNEITFLIRTKLDERRAPPAPSPQAGPPQAANPPALDISVDNKIYQQPTDPTWTEAWRVTEGLIKEIHTEVNQQGANFVLVVGSNPVQAYPDQAVRERFQSYVGTDNLFYPNERLARLAKQERIDFIDLAPSLQKYADEKKVFLHGFGKQIGNGHWNVEGHRVAADLIAQKLCAAP